MIVTSLSSGKGILARSLPVSRANSEPSVAYRTFSGPDAFHCGFLVTKTGVGEVIAVALVT
jgi:hypothetical protein